MKKLLNYLLAMAFAVTPVLIYREYADEPNNHLILQTIGIATAFWVIVPAWMKWIKSKITTASEGWYTGKQSFYAFAMFLALWGLILYTNG